MWGSEETICIWWQRQCHLFKKSCGADVFLNYKPEVATWWLRKCQILKVEEKLSVWLEDLPKLHKQREGTTTAIIPNQSPLQPIPEDHSSAISSSKYERGDNPTPASLRCEGATNAGPPLPTDFRSRPHPGRPHHTPHSTHFTHNMTATLEEEPQPAIPTHHMRTEAPAPATLLREGTTNASIPDKPPLQPTPVDHSS